MIKAIAVAVTVAVVMASGNQCSQGSSSSGGGSGGQIPGQRNVPVKVCDTNITYGPRLNTTGYEFKAVEVRANTICDVEPTSHQLLMTMKFRAKSTDPWALFIPANGGAVGGYCYSGLTAKDGKPPGNCDMAVPCQTGEWSVGVHATGNGPPPANIYFEWDLPTDEAPIKQITCPVVPKPRT